MKRFIIARDISICMDDVIFGHTSLYFENIGNGKYKNFAADFRRLKNHFYYPYFIIEWFIQFADAYFIYALKYPDDKVKY